MKEKVLLAFMLAVITGCAAELTNDVVELLPFRMVYTATIENPDTKVFVDGNLKTHWNEGDEISIFTTTYNQHFKFDGQTGDDDGSFTMQGDSQSGKEIPATYAVYPYDESTSISTKGVLSICFPSVQNYAENSYGLGANTMVAVAESNTSTELFFSNLCGYVVVRLYGEGTVKSITLTGNNGEKLAGQATVNARYGQSPVVSFSESAITSITLDCGEGVELGKTVDEAIAFWFAVPPVTFSQGFTIRVANTDLWSMEKVMKVERIVTRNVKNPLAPLAVNFDIPREGNIEFEDANFKAYCVENFDKDGDENISFIEALLINNIDCSGMNITSLKGIEYCTNLDSLRCSMNKLSSIDVSHNLDLIYLNCSSNQLNALDVSHNSELKALYIRRNNLSCIDVSHNLMLQSFACSYNQINSLEISNNACLSYLDCSNNLLSVLDLRNNTALSRLTCTNNQITDLDVSNNIYLTELRCGTNILSSLNVSHNSSLERLVCDSNALTSLSANNNPLLIELNCGNNLLSSLSVDKDVSLINIGCSYNYLSSLDIQNNTELHSLYCTNNRLESLDVSYNTALHDLYCENNPFLTEIWLKIGQTIADFRYDTAISTVYYK